MKRRLTAILAGTGLVAIIIGLPAGLIATANVAAPHHGWTPAGLWQALLAPDDGTLLVTIVKLAGWISWAILTGTIALDIASRARHLPVPQLRGMAWPQHLARGLVTAVMAGFIATNTITTSAPDPTLASPPTPTAIPLAATLPAHPPAKTADHARSYTVKRGDTLSEIALDKLGDGHAYPRIYNASKTTIQPDGRRLTDPDLIIPGWKLTIPTRHTDTPTPPKPEKPHHADPDPDQTTSKPVPIPAETVAATTPPAPRAPAPAATSAPTTTTAPDRTAPAPVDAESADHELVTPAWLVAGLVGAGSLLAGALWLMLQRRRRAQWRARRPGRSIVVPAQGYAPIEKTLEQAGAPTGDIVTAIDEALRRLTAILHANRQPIPTLAELTATPDTL
ncbi:MAG: LysM peptidoglycan-binding domain-containing protein, partial [Actinobacteria bacterium]|nr:LysM peptidoglycan-binding domain-containing protein [Actinomycetota bacterium]